jgi:hypothetical protein
MLLHRDHPNPAFYMRTFMTNKVVPPPTAPVSRVIALIAILCAMFGQSFAQTTPADTQIQNQASATYSDGSGASYSTVSNTVTVTVAKVSGLAITPDGASDPNVVPGQTGVLFNFVVENTGNFSDEVLFLSGGASVYLSGTSPATITRAVIDEDNNGFDSGDVDIFTNGADVTSASISQGNSINVLVEVNINGTASAGETVQVFLGDAGTGSPTFDNQAVVSSANEVRTVSTASVNGVREARGDRSVTVANDAILQLSLTAPTGPVPLGSVISYNWELCNIGAQPASSVTLVNGPVGSNSGVFIFAPIPAGTQLDATQSFPGGVGVLYSTSPLSDNPVTTAVWTTAQPPLANITRVAFNVGNSLPVGVPCAPAIDMNVLITTTDATNPISEQGVAFATNSLTAQISDLSELRLTTLQMSGSVLNGPQGQPGAVGPTDTNDDYTNKSVNTGIAGVAPGGVTTAAGTVSFTNTVQNTGNANDSFTLTVTAFPAGASVVVNGVTVVNNGVATGNPVPPLAIAFGSSANYQVDVELPPGKVVLTGYDTVIRATSANTVASTNDTIDRVYTGFLRLDKTASVSNLTGVGGPTDSVPGAEITFSITYTNVSSSGGTNNITLTATNIVITENGSVAPNNWATYTDHVDDSASDTLGGTIVGDDAGSTLLTDTIASLTAGQSGVFSFKRLIK